MRLTLALIEVRSQVLRGYVRSPRPASPGSTTEVEACHPHVQLSGEPLGPAQAQAFTVRSRYRVNARRPTPIPVGQPDMRMPPWALAVAKTHPRGLTGRVGAGQRPGLPRDEARFSSRRLGRNPPSGTQSLDKTPLGNRMVAWSEKNWMGSSRPVSGPFSGWGPNAGKWRPPARPRCGATC